MWRKMVLLAAMAALGTVTAAHANQWLADFDDWSGQNGTSVSNYTDIGGLNPRSFSVQADVLIGPAQAEPWLSQGDAGGNKAAKFLNIVDSSNGRVRFRSNLPETMDLTQGISVAWRMRVGPDNTGRGQIQIAVTTTGATSGSPFNAYIRLRNSGHATGNSFIDILRNGGGQYSGLTGANDPLRVDTLVLNKNLTNQFAQWSAAIVHEPVENKAYWKLWLDGELLLFDGPSGSPELNGEQYSFRTFQESFTGDPYIGLGDLNTQNAWDFEFDCVVYKDDGLEQLGCGVSPSCESIVTPVGVRTSAALRNNAAEPASHVYTITNAGTAELAYSAVEMQKVAPVIADLYNTGVDNSRVTIGEQLADPHWTIVEGGLFGGCTPGAPCPAYTVLTDGFPIPPWLYNDSSSLWITVSPTDHDAIAPTGDHTFRTTFTLANQAAVDAAMIRGRMAFDDSMVDVQLNGTTVVGALAAPGFSTWSHFTIESGFQVGTNTLDFKVRNGGTAANPMGFRVEFYDIVPGDVPWLALDKSGGVIPASGNDSVIASIVNTDLPDGTYSAYVGFTDDCPDSAMQLRRIDLTIVDCRSAVAPAANTGRAIRLGTNQVAAPVSYSIQNTGSPPLNYTVTSSAAWLQLDKNGGGPIASGGSDVVTGTIDPTGLSAGGHVATVTFTDSCNPAIQHVRQVLLSIDENLTGSTSALQQFNAEFTTFTGSDLVAESPLESCDPAVVTDRKFSITFNEVGSLPSGWLTQGTLDGVPTTAKFFNEADGLAGRARFRTFLPFDNTFDPSKGMAVAWSMRVGSGDVITRGPIQITFPRVSGPFATDNANSSVAGETFNVFFRIQSGTNVRILNNGGGAIGSIDQLVLANTIADDYHQWSAAVCYNAVDQMAYWNVWIDGEKLMFTGANGSVVGPDGGIFSFRTNLENVTGDPYIGLGELGGGEDVWDFEFDWVRMLSYNVSGCPFWDGEGCIPVPPCNVPFADVDGDGDVDMDDFAQFQLCINRGLAAPASLPEACRCFDRNNNKVIGDSFDLMDFAACGTGANVPWQPGPGCE